MTKPVLQDATWKPFEVDFLPGQEESITTALASVGDMGWEDCRPPSSHRKGGGRNRNKLGIFWINPSLCPGLSGLSFSLKTPWGTEMSTFWALCHSIVTRIIIQHWWNNTSYDNFIWRQKEKYFFNASVPGLMCFKVKLSSPYSQGLRKYVSYS